MKKNIFINLGIPALVFLMAVAPFLCCCFESAAAGIAPSMQEAHSPCGHCGSGTDAPSKDHPRKECDCPQALAEGSLSGIQAPKALPGSLRKMCDEPLTQNQALVTALSLSLAAPEMTGGPSCLQHSPPLFVLNRSLRL